MSLVFHTDHTLAYSHASIPQIPLQTCLSRMHTTKLNATPQYKYILKSFALLITKAYVYTDGGCVLLHFSVNHRESWIMCISGWFCILYSFFFHLLETYSLITHLWESKPPADSTLYHENDWRIEKGSSRVFYGCDIPRLASIISKVQVLLYVSYIGNICLKDWVLMYICDVDYDVLSQPIITYV